MSKQDIKSAIERAERHAEETGKTYLIVASLPPGSEPGTGSCLPYYVREDQANEWERANAAVKIGPPVVK